jgi:hypothetical protein
MKIEKKSEKNEKYVDFETTRMTLTCISFKKEKPYFNKLSNCCFNVSTESGILVLLLFVPKKSVNFLQTIGSIVTFIVSSIRIMFNN